MRDEVNKLKAKLGTIPSDKWQRAQAVMDQICVLCEVHGPNYAKMVPRACKICKFYGHTSQFCPWDLERTALQCMREAAQYTPVTEENSTPEQWKWMCGLRAIEKRVNEGVEKGFGRCEVHTKPARSAADYVECGCGACMGWDQWMAPVRREWAVARPSWP